VKLRDTDTEFAQVGEPYSKNAPAFPGYLYAGAYHGAYEAGATGGIPENLITGDPVLTLTASDRQVATDTWTFVYEPGVTFTASVDGAADRRTSRTLTMEFSSPVKSLTAGELSLGSPDPDTADASMGTPAGRNGNQADGYRTWSVPLSGVSAGEVSVSITRNGFKFVPAQVDANKVTLCKGPLLVSAIFDGEEDRVTTRELTLTFDKPVADLNVLTGALLALDGDGKADVAELANAVQVGGSVGDADYGKIWRAAVSRVSTQGDVAVKVSLPAAQYTLDDDEADGQVFSERRYLVYHKGSADFVKGSPPLAQSGANFGLLFTEGFRQTVEGAGTLSKSGYVFYGWSTTDTWGGSGLPSEDAVYFRGVKMDLDTPWTRKADGTTSGTQALPEGSTDLYPVWLAAPQPRLNAPVVTSGGRAMITGRVVRVTNDYNVRLEYREQGQANWTLLFDEDEYGILGDGGAQPVWRFFDDETDAPAAYIPAAALTPGKTYEVRLTATDAIVPRNAPSATDTAVFRVPTQGSYGGGADIPGIVDNQTGSGRKVIVTLQEGDITIAAPQIISVGAGSSARFAFNGVADGYFNVVADYDGERVTRGVKITQGISYEVISGKRLGDGNLLTLVLERKQSIVSIPGGNPLASIDGLPELFGINKIFDVQGDELDALADRGGTAEFRMEASYLGSKSSAPGSQLSAAVKAAIESAAAVKKHTPVEYYDLSLYKANYDMYGVPAADARQTTDIGANNNLVIAFKLPASVPAKALAAVYRVHGVGAGGKPNVQALGRGAANKNSAGEYFEVDGAYVLIHAGKFSAYALATAPINSGNSGGGKGNGNGTGSTDGKGGTGTGGSGAYRTGDEFSPEEWWLMFMMFGTALTLAVYYRRRRQE
jgi:hypothetical protein